MALAFGNDPYRMLFHNIIILNLLNGKQEVAELLCSKFCRFINVPKYPTTYTLSKQTVEFLQYKLAEKKKFYVVEFMTTIALLNLRTLT